MNGINSHLMFWSRLGFEYDPPILDENDKPRGFDGDYEGFARFHKEMADDGVKLHTSILSSGWIGPDRYDYRLTDKTLDALFSAASDILYIPRVKLNVPLEWAKANPEELFVYFNGPREVNDIQALVGTLKHDLLGYDSPNGYYQGNDSRPNVGGLISNQSFASEKWLRDAGEALRRLIEHIKNGPYANRIIGYHIAYGVCGESMLWGRQSNRFGDYGIAARKAFAKWGLERYGNLDVLRKVWNQPKLDKTIAEIPPPSQRIGRYANLTEFFRADEKDQVVIDHDLFMSEINVGAIEYFAKIVKKHTDDQAIVGTFYGYILECFNSAYTGHLAFERILNSPSIDFLAAPTSYYRRNVGEPGGAIAPAQSVNRRKLWIDEIDIRTYLAKEMHNIETLQETQTVLWREFAKTVSQGSRLWWMDLGGGWFNSPEIHSIIKNIQVVFEQLKDRASTPISEILFVVDEDSISHMSPHKSFHRLVMQDSLREAGLCGVPCDVFRLKDLATLDMSRYKIVVFLNTFLITPQQRSVLKDRLSNINLVVWTYAPGLLAPELNMDNASTICGFDLEENNPASHAPMITFDPESPLASVSTGVKYESSDHLDIPLLSVRENPNMKVWGRYGNGKAAIAARCNSNGKYRIYQSLPLLKAAHIRKLAEMAGCNLYAPLGCTVYGDSRFIGLFPKTKIMGKLVLKTKCDLTDVMTGESWKNTTGIPLKMEERTGKVLINDFTPPFTH